MNSRCLCSFKTVWFSEKQSICQSVRKEYDIKEEFNDSDTNVNFKHAYSDLSQSLWSELIDTAAYLKNWSSMKHFKSKTSHETLHDVKSNLSHLKIISCLCWALILKKKCDKLNFKFKKCQLLEYEIFTQFILYDVKDKHVIWSHDI